MASKKKEEHEEPQSVLISLAFEYLEKTMLEFMNEELWGQSGCKT